MDRPKLFRHHGFRGQIGIARRDITPPSGVYSRNWGAAQHDVADSIHRELTITALCLQSRPDGLQQILLDADLGWWKTPDTFDEFHEKLLSSCGLKPEQLIFALSHTHAGPPLMQPDTTLDGAEPLQQWYGELMRQCREVIGEAQAHVAEGLIQWETGNCNLASVRDLPDPDHARILCGFAPEEQPDHTLIVGRIADASGNLRGTITNYACHPTTLAWENTAISPDYLGAMRQTIQQATGVPSMFALGACGDLAPRYQYVGDHGVADRHGRCLGYAVLSVLESMEPVGQALEYQEAVESGAPLAVWRHRPDSIGSELSARSTEVSLPIKDWPSADQLETERQNCKDRAIEERLRRKRDIRRSLGDGDTYNLKLYGWRMGDAILIGSCCEPYSVIQQTLRSRFPSHTVVCMNLINGSLGYLPPQGLYDHDVYPVWQTPFARGAMERYLEATESLANELIRSHE